MSSLVKLVMGEYKKENETSHFWLRLFRTIVESTLLMSRGHWIECKKYLQKLETYFT